MMIHSAELAKMTILNSFQPDAGYFVEVVTDLPNANYEWLIRHNNEILIRSNNGYGNSTVPLVMP